MWQFVDTNDVELSKVYVSVVVPVLLLLLLLLLSAVELLQVFFVFEQNPRKDIRLELTFFVAAIDRVDEPINIHWIVTEPKKLERL